MMRMLLCTIVIAVGGVLLASPPAYAQTDDDRYGILLRGGSGFGHVATADGYGGGSDAGAFGWGIGAWYAVLPAVSLHLGYDQQRFACTDSGVAGWCENEPRFNSGGMSLDARIGRPRGLLRPWAGAGIGYRALHTRVNEWSDTSDGALALSASAGLEVRAMPRIYIGPSIRYAAHDRPMPGGPAERVQIVSGDIGIRVGF